MLKAFYTVQKICGEYFFSGYSDSKEEGVWLDVNEKKNLTFVEWAWNNPNNGGGFYDQDCLTIDINTNQTNDWTCLEILCPICQVPKKTSYHLQGICENSYIDRFFVLQSDRYLLGYMQTKMFWADENNRWEIFNLITGKVEAFMNASSGFPIGKHDWFFTDHSNCSDESRNSRSLNFHLTVEQPGEFCCDDGICIDSDRVCDGEKDCYDDSDEKSCDLVKITNEKYNNLEPPRRSFQKTDLLVTTEILKILEIDETDYYFYIVFKQKLSWKDENLKFSFLKDSANNNLVTGNERKSIWIPNQQYCCYTYNEKAELQSNFEYIEKKGKPKLDDSDYIQPHELYMGDENLLVKEILQRAKFSCSFDNNNNYPFGTDQCFFETFIPDRNNNLTNLIPEKLIDLGQSTLGQFSLRWTVSSGKTIYHHSGIIYTLHLQRNLINILLVTYVPTVLMNLINQATNYISSSEKYELIITVNITCMVVLASIYLSVSSNLSATVITPVEVWLLFSLVYPAIIILVNILIQVNILSSTHES